MLLAASTFLVGTLEAAMQQPTSRQSSSRRTRSRRASARWSSRTARRARKPPRRSTTRWTSPAASTPSTTASAAHRPMRSARASTSIGAEDNTVVIFSELMDAKSLFLTANADTVYYLAAIDLTKGPMVIEQPPKAVGTHQRHVVRLDHRHRLPRPRPRRRRQVPDRAAGL